MNREVALGLLSVANTGDEILAVLDSIEWLLEGDDAVKYLWPSE